MALGLFRAGNKPMFQHILIPTDGSLLSRAAVDGGLALARHAGARVMVLAVVEPPADAGQLPAEAVDEARAAARAHLEDARQAARAQGVPCTVLEVEHDQPHRAIVECAERAGCDLIAMASHARRGIAALITGSETSQVLSNTSIPVLVYR